MVTANRLTEILADCCPRHGIDLAGAVALPCALPHADRFRAWTSNGRDGGLAYLTRDPEGRLDPTRRNPEARTLLVFAQRYTDGWPAGDSDPSAGGAGAESGETPWTARVARYARGRDYHDILLRDIQGVLAELRAEWPDLTAHASTDTGPYLEREYAWLAGLGFLGKNTCLIHERLGSGLFLGVALTDLEVTGLPEPGQPAPVPLYGALPRRARPPQEAYVTACGACTRCIDACPTAAIDPQDGLDAGRCLSTWTIEHRGQTPAAERPLQGGVLFGCDICQAVCPWNRRAAARAADATAVMPPPPRAAYRVLPEHAEIDLADLVRLSDDAFRHRFRRTPIWRCHPEGLRRNALIVAANLGLTLGVDSTEEPS